MDKVSYSAKYNLGRNVRYRNVSLPFDAPTARMQPVSISGDANFFVTERQDTIYLSEAVTVSAVSQRCQTQLITMQFELITTLRKTTQFLKLRQ